MERIVVNYGYVTLEVLRVRNKERDGDRYRVIERKSSVSTV